MRQILSTGLVALIVGALAGATVGAVAQSPAEQATSPSAVSNINADKVDGRHAVGSGASKAKRARKLVATNSSGFLPSNIVKPKWGKIKNKPAGFADGVDNRGVWKVTLSTVYAGVYVDGQSTRGVSADCPPGSQVVGGGFELGSQNLRINRSMPSGGDSWSVMATNDHPTSNSQLSAYAICLGTTPSGALKTG